jgi:hypothetical protein
MPINPSRGEGGVSGSPVPFATQTDEADCGLLSIEDLLIRLRKSPPVLPIELFQSLKN